MMTQEFVLLPAPRYLELGGERFQPQDSGLIALGSADPQAILPSARRLQAELHAVGDLDWEIVAGTTAPLDQVRAELLVIPGGAPHEQGYDLTVAPKRIHVVAASPAGVFYALATLRQLIAQLGAGLPSLRCRDWPDYPNRGVMLDISRNKVPSMETLYELVDLLASWKINQLQLYTEHTFAYRRHPLVWAQASPMTGEQILALDAFCRARFIELVPNQNTFAHMRPWLIHERYRHLAECPDGCDTRWGRFDEPFSLAPGEPGSLDLVRDLLDELLPHFSSRQVNIGGDEPVDLESAQGRSAGLVKERGFGRVYLDYMLKVYNEVRARGRSAQIWGDIVMEHPELVPELPRDLVALEWGYEADHPFDEHGAAFAASGVPFYVCPGTSSWRTLAGRTDNAVVNLRNAARSGLEHGAAGVLITDWGDEGHWQPLPVSYLGFAYGAALAWGYEANLELDIPRALDAHAFRDPGGVMGGLAYDLGNIYQAPGILTPNSSALFNVLQAPPDRIVDFLRARDYDLAQATTKLRLTLEEINQVAAALPGARMERPDAALVQREFAWAAEMQRHACRRALWAIERAYGRDDAAVKAGLAEEAVGLAAEFEAIWQARNRPGGFQDSFARLQVMRADYLD
jgi:hypothetical protein